MARSLFFFLEQPHMPWEAKKVGQNWCSVNKDTGKSVACFGPNGEQKAEDHVKALYANTKEKLEEGETYGLTLLRVAYTNEPHLDLRKHPISIVELDGEEYVRHPILVAGHYRHPNGVLNLNTIPVTNPKHQFNRVLANHYGGVTQSGVYTRPHHTSREAWAWLSTEQGGWLTVEEEMGDTILVGYGKMTAPERLEALKRGDYMYTSADLHLRYQGNRLLETQEVISWEQLILEEDFMPTDDSNVITLEKSEHERLLDAAKKAEEALAKIKNLEKERDDLSAKVTKLEEQLQGTGDHDDDLPEEVRRELEQMKLELEQAKNQRVMDRLKLALKQAGKPDKDGGILDSFTINAVLSFAQGQEIKDEEGGLVIKLEQSSNPHEQRRTTIEFLTYLLENAPRIPGSKTVGTEQRLEQSGNGQITLGDDDMEEIRGAWGVMEASDA
jgi:hypothetical protein